MQKIMKLIVTIGLFLSWSLSVFSQTEVYKVEKEGETEGGIIYYLPKTVLILEIETEKTVKRAGTYYKYAERYLGVTDFIVKDEETYTIKNVNIKTRSIPDLEKKYAVKITPSSSAIYLSLTDNGILEGVNLNPPPCEKEDSKDCNKAKEKEEITFSYNVLTKEMLQANAVAKMAELLANQLYKIREYRYDLLSGNENMPEGGSLEALLKEMKEKEDEITSLFVGKKRTEQEKFIVEIIPDGDIADEVAFRFSQSAGVVDKNDLSGRPYYISLESNRENAVNPETKKKGLFYCQPGSADVQINDGKKRIAEKNVTIAQFGSVLSLPATIFDKAKLKIKLSPLTGSILQISNNESKE